MPGSATKISPLRLHAVRSYALWIKGAPRFFARRCYRIGMSTATLVPVEEYLNTSYDPDVPDVCVLLASPRTRYLIDAAHIAVEILSEDDSMSKMLEKLEEYAAKGVPNIWLIDPRLQRISVYAAGNLDLVKGDTISTSDGIELTRDEIFQQ
jgi:Uma2 family endonuclease